MANNKPLEVFWTQNAAENAIRIKKYIAYKFTEKEVLNFFSLLQSFEIAVSAFPKLYPESTFKKNIRRAVLSKELSVFYRIHKNKIEVLTCIDNRCDITNWI